MRLICPHCMSGVTVPDDVAGKEATCPNCGKPFPTPARYSAAVVPEAPVPPPVPPPPAPPEPKDGSMYALELTPAPPGLAPAPPPAPSGFLPHAAPSQAQVPTPAGYTKSIGITISPRVVAVLPAVLLTLAVVLTFFPWVATHLGGSPVYSQGPWRAVFGAINQNAELESVAPAGPIDHNKVPSDWYLMVPFLLLLILAAALALADRGFSSLDPRKIPPLAKIWPVRHTVIAALSTAAVALVVIQSINGFGLERAVRQTVRENPALVREREAAQGDKRKLAMVRQNEDQELAKFDLNRTVWMHLAVTCTVLGALATVCTIALERRGNKPPPRLIFHY